MNHNLKTVPRLYKEARPGADYSSLKLLKDFKELYPNIQLERPHGSFRWRMKILEVMRDMREHHIDDITIGSYSTPSLTDLQVRRYVHPDTFKMFKESTHSNGLFACCSWRDGEIRPC
jgi:lipoic acid synthetase